MGRANEDSTQNRIWPQMRMVCRSGFLPHRARQRIALGQSFDWRSSLEAMSRHCDPIREKYSVIPGRYPDRMYLFMGFSLVTTLSR